MVKQTQLFELLPKNSAQKLTFYSSLEKLNRACLECDRCSLSQQGVAHLVNHFLRGIFADKLSAVESAPTAHLAIGLNSDTKINKRLLTS